MRSLHFILIYSMLGDQLFPMIWNAVARLENLGFIVLALCLMVCPRTGSFFVFMMRVQKRLSTKLLTLMLMMVIDAISSFCRIHHT